MQILITGGAGFIGSRLDRAAALQGHDVFVFDSFHPQVHAQIERGSLTPSVVLPGDVRDPRAWDRCFLLHGEPDVIVHLAAETGTGQSLTEASRHGSTNVVGTTQMTDALVRHRITPSQIIVASSRAVYGEGSWSTDAGEIFYPGPRTGERLAAGLWDPASPSEGGVWPVPHDAATTWPRPTNVYAATKLAQEHVLEAWCSAQGVPLSILRLQNVFGPGQAVGNSYTGVLTFFARQIASGQEPELFEDGAIVRDFVFVDDVVEALISAIDREPTDIRRVDIGGGSQATLLQVASMMCEMENARPPVVSGRYRLGDVRAASASIAAACTDLGWEPTTSLPDGLQALQEWVPTQLAAG